jgi:hypothetical protein
MGKEIEWAERESQARRLRVRQRLKNQELDQTKSVGP